MLDALGQDTDPCSSHCLKWLVKLAIATKEEMGDYIRAYSESQFNKKHTTPEVCVYVCVCVYMCVYMCVCVCVHVCVCIHT